MIRVLMKLPGWLGCFLVIASVANADVPAEQLHMLSRGINLDSSVFEHPKPPAEVSRDLAGIQRAGFHHVRIFLTLEDWSDGNLDTNWRVARLDMIVAAAVQNHLAVMLCPRSIPHPMNDAATAATVKIWETGWRRLAQRYRSVAPDRMFFEIANEPGMDGTRWAGIQEQLRAAIRQVAPTQTLLLTPSPLAMVWSLSTLGVSQDSNVVYVFHLYQPMVFTHQSAGWADPVYGRITNLAYPPDEANIHDIMARPLVAQDPKAIKYLTQYEQIGGGMIRKETEVAVQWAREHGVHMAVTEFGAYATAPPASRAAWLREARQGFEAAGFGWTVFQYEGSFEIKTDLEKGCDIIMEALGLCK
jgi:endoglucanase